MSAVFVARQTWTAAGRTIDLGVYATPEAAKRACERLAKVTSPPRTARTFRPIWAHHGRGRLPKVYTLAGEFNGAAYSVHREQVIR